MIDLLDTTFIIPICIESSDRKVNALTTLSYLCNHLFTNIIIYEYDTISKMPEIINSVKDKYPKNLTLNGLTHIFEQNKSGNDIFHRTKFLNEMLNLVKTNIVVNYDIDILLQPSVYRKCSNLINSGFDLVYPYFFGKSQYQINYTGKDKVIKSLLLNDLLNTDYQTYQSAYGHCQFFKTKSYIDGGMENENFISYGPEDQERGYRFKTLGYKVMWSDDYVYHMEHTRGNNSSTNNPMMAHNNKLFDYLKTLSNDQLREYYNNIDYIKKYKGLK